MGWARECPAKRSRILAFNGKKPENVFPRYRTEKTLTPAMIQRIAHQVEAKCRDVAPRAYSEWKETKMR
jgi:hypothetical protein